MIDSPWIMFVLLPLIAYVVGSTPFGVIIARAKGIDLRKSGSGNVGATNVGRALGRRWGYLCFGLDTAKGLLPVVAAGWLLGMLGPRAEHDVARQLAWLLVGCGAILGHVFAFWLRFHGGKGVATALGVVVGVFPYFTYAGLTAFALWIVVTLISRYVSLGSITAAGGFVPLVLLYGWLLGWPVGELWPLLIFAVAMVSLIIIRHRTNIVRLANGTENKISLQELPRRHRGH